MSSLHKRVCMDGYTPSPTAPHPVYCSTVPVTPPPPTPVGFFFFLSAESAKSNRFGRPVGGGLTLDGLTDAMNSTTTTGPDGETWEDHGLLDASGGDVNVHSSGGGGGTAAALLLNQVHDDDQARTEVSSCGGLSTTMFLSRRVAFCLLLAGRRMTSIVQTILYRTAPLLVTSLS